MSPGISFPTGVPPPSLRHNDERTATHLSPTIKPARINKCMFNTSCIAAAHESILIWLMSSLNNNLIYCIMCTYNVFKKSVRFWCYVYPLTANNWFCAVYTNFVSVKINAIIFLFYALIIFWLMFIQLQAEILNTILTINKIIWSWGYVNR